MGEVDAFQVPGLKCYFPSGDHYPHHFEVLRRGEYIIRVYFLRTSRKRGLNWDYKRQMDGELRAEDAEVLYELVMKNKRRLLREWNEKVCPDRKR